MHKGGFKNTVACMGTALTKDHIQELKRYSKNIVLCFDNDSAGVKATLRAIELFRGEGVDLKVTTLHGGKDADEVLNNLGSVELEKMIDNAVPYMNYLISHFQGEIDLNKPEEKGRFVKIVLNEIKKLESDTEREPYLDIVRDLTNIPVEVLRRDLGGKINMKMPKKENIVETAVGGNIKAVTFILSSLLHHKDFVNNQIDYYKLLDDYERYLKIIELNMPLSSLYDLEGTDKDRLLLDMINYNFSLYKDVEEKYFNECVWMIAEEKLKKEQARLNAEYKNCEDLTRRAEIAKDLGKIARDLKNKNLEVFYVG